MSVTQHQFRDRCAIAGLGITTQGKLPHLSVRQIANWAITLAIDDAGIKRSDIDGFLYYPENYPAIADCHYYGLTPKVHLGMETGGATANVMVMTACNLITSGLASTVLCFDGGRTKSDQHRTGSTRYGIGQMWGLYSAIASVALNSRRHMHLYGTTAEQMGAVALTQRAYANLRPDAVDHGKTLTMAEYLASPMIADPLRRYDCTRDADGAVALIVTSAERAKQLKRKPVHIMGAGVGHSIRHWHDKTLYDALDIQVARDTALKTAGIGIRDIDTAQFYDGFSILVIMQLESYGFCKPGEGGAFVADGQTKLTGKIPTNTGGGQLSGYYRQGFTPLAEAARQLRGESGKTQVKDAEIALVSGHGGNAGVQNTWAHSTLILRK